MRGISGKIGKLRPHPSKSTKIETGFRLAATLENARLQAGNGDY
jgi:hypothetical protein